MNDEKANKMIITFDEQAKLPDDQLPILSDHLALTTILEQSSDSIFFKDLKSRFIFVNRNKAERHGIENPKDMIGKTDFDYVSQKSAEDMQVIEQSIMQTGHSVIEIIEKIDRLDGRTTWASVSKYPLRDADQQIIGIWGISRDITESELTKRALFASEAKYRTMVENISDVIAISNRFRVIKYVSPNINRYFGWLAEDLVGSSLKLYIHPDDQGQIPDTDDHLLANRKALQIKECRFLCKDGSTKIIDATVANMDDNQSIEGILITIHDISERKNKEKEILYLSYHDVMTGLYNRTFFEAEKTRLDTERQLPISIIMGDANGLKLTNDAYGHAAGDQLLVEIAAILKKCCRKEDIIARIGGDEFCILLPQTDSTTAQAICRRIYQSCETYRETHENINHFPSISLGFATKTSADDSINDILKDAEDHMYRSKLLERKSTHSSIINSIAATLQESSNDTKEHSDRMIHMARDLGAALNLVDEQLLELELLARLHDIGKISIDRSILSKPGKLTEEEWVKVRQHPEIGYRIAQASLDLVRISHLILSHHERWDGQGYPQGLKGTDIPLLARIIAVIDAYDAMTQDRPYRKAMPEEAAVKEIIDHAGDQFDPRIARIFIEQVIRKPWDRE